jgi:hypothetical protein
MGTHIMNDRLAIKTVIGNQLQLIYGDSAVMAEIRATLILTEIEIFLKYKEKGKHEEE